MDIPSIPSLFKQLRDDTTELIRKEIALAKAEIVENVSTALRNIVSLIIGAFVALVALIMALMALAKFLASFLISLDIEPHVADMLGFLITSLLLGGIAAVIIAKAMQALQHNPLRPDKTIESLKEDKQWAKEKLK